MATHPLIVALRAATLPVLLKQLRTLFEGADDALFGMSQREGVVEDARSSFDIMRLLRLERRRIEADFERLMSESFEAAADAHLEEFDLDRLSIQQTEELEERIAVGNLVSKAESQHKVALEELKKRIVHMIRDLGIAVSRQALTPTTICNAFKTSIANLELPLAVRLLLYKLFDKSFVGELRTVYAAAMQMLDANQIHPPVLDVPAAEPASPFSAPALAQGVVDDSIEPPTLDSATRNALREISKPGSGHRPQDAQFAEELFGLAETGPGQPRTVTRVAPAQRMSLVGQMCNEILSDPHLPPAMRPLFERLRFPLIKIALADGTFFSNRVHPVRRLVAEAAETAASSRVSTPAVVRRLEERLRHIAEQIDLSATFVRPQIVYLTPLTMLEIACFLDQQREESETRRENVLNKVRRTVAQELEVHTLGRKPPAGLVSFLRIGWGPLMAARLLRHGMNSRPWIDAVNRLVQILSSMDVVDLSPDHTTVRGDLLAVISRDLGEIGMRDDKIATARGQLERAYADLDERVAKMTPLERELQTHDLGVLTPTEAAAVMAEFPTPGSLQSRAPATEIPREPMRLDLPSEIRVAPAPAPTPSRPVPPPAAPEAKTPVPPVAPSHPPAKPVATPVAREPDRPAPQTTPKAAASTPPSAPPAPAQVAATPAVVGSVEPDIGEQTPEANLLALCLTAESWFRVFDSGNGQTLWLKVSRYYPEHDSIGFNGFDAKKTLSIRASRFIRDLVSGRSEPVNASPVQIRAMAELRRRHKA